MYSKLSNQKKIISFVIVCGVLVVGYIAYGDRAQIEKTGNEKTPATNDYKSISYLIDGELVMLTTGYSESDAIPDSEARSITRYFGNELVTDLDGDGDEDITFILVQETAGSGTFYYAVAALNTENGYVGTDGYLLGDRIAPQSTTVSPNPRHNNVVVFNYAEREVGESMTTQPSVGQSVYLKVDIDSMRWGIVEPDFEGESAL